MIGQTVPAQFVFGPDYIQEHFGSNVPLATQQITHNLYRDNPERLVDLILRCLSLSGREAILDVGCGNGFILGEVSSRLRHGGRAIGLDVSMAMLDLARKNTTKSLVPIELVHGVAEDLSAYPDCEFDRVMTNFIFHYIDEPHRVIGEVTRVLKPDGVLVLAIEARNSMGEMYDLHFEAMERCGFPKDFISRLPRGRRGKMVLDNARDYLDEHFGTIEEHPYVDALRFRSAEPFLNFYCAGHRYCGAKAMAGEEIPDELFAHLESEVTAVVERSIKVHGCFTLRKRNSVFVCTNPIPDVEERNGK